MEVDEGLTDYSGPSGFVDEIRVKHGMAKPPNDVAMTVEEVDNDLRRPMCQEREMHSLGRKDMTLVLVRKVCDDITQTVAMSRWWLRKEDEAREGKQGCNDDNHEHHEYVP